MLRKIRYTCESIAHAANGNQLTTMRRTLETGVLFSQDLDYCLLGTVVGMVHLVAT
ncbi:MAG: hypothetical protein LAP38_28450 [Acidobacteriia bacterium]|nr:hypothetical protein [Terriglobia bacterium]